MVDYAIMFEVEEGGVLVPINWNKDKFIPEKSIIILDEPSLHIVLWHGSHQGIVNRRIALRQAESLKGHGYNFGNMIIGMNAKNLIEIDQRKVGRDPETDKLNQQLEEIFNRKFKEHEDFVVTFGEGVLKPIVKSKKEIKANENAIVEEIENKGIQKSKLEQTKTKPVQKEVVKPETPTKTKIAKEPVQKLDIEKNFLLDLKKALESFGGLSSMMEKIERIEKTVENLNERMKKLEVIGPNDVERIPQLVKDIRVMKEAVKKNENIPDKIKYPTRDEFIHAQMTEMKNRNEAEK